jgi:hypothetical protein
MTYTDYSNFYEYVLPEVHGCPKGVAKNAIRDAAIEFCDKTQIWTAPSTTTDIKDGYSRYAFDTRTDGAIVTTVAYAAVSNNPIELIDAQSLSQLASDWRNLESSSPTKCFMDTNETIRLVGTPTKDIDDGLYVEVALKPSRTSTECPSFLLENWAEEIAHGALARLKAMVGRVWADGNLVAYHRSEFRAGVSRAKTAAQKSRLTTSKSMAAQNFLRL